MKAKSWFLALSVIGFSVVLACLALARSQKKVDCPGVDVNDPLDPEATVYLGNSETQTLHLATCRFLPSPEKTVLLVTRQQATDAGYVPCRVCHP